MEVNDYVIQYPIDAVHTVKFADAYYREGDR